jgi:hypothetical protein
MMIGIAEKLRRLKEAVALLAAEPADQLGAFPPWVVRVDEVALTFDDCYGFVPELECQRLLTESQVAKLKSIDQKLAAMSGEDNSSLWTEEAIKSRKEWQWVRTSARAIFARADIEQMPKLDWLVFVPGTSTGQRRKH